MVASRWTLKCHLAVASLPSSNPPRGSLNSGPHCELKGSAFDWILPRTENIVPSRPITHSRQLAQAVIRNRGDSSERIRQAERRKAIQRSRQDAGCLFHRFALAIFRHSAMPQGLRAPRVYPLSVLARRARNGSGGDRLQHKFFAIHNRRAAAVQARAEEKAA